MALSRTFGLSRRQAYRYLELARAGAPAPSAAENSITSHRLGMVLPPVLDDFSRYIIALETVHHDKKPTMSPPHSKWAPGRFGGSTLHRPRSAVRQRLLT
jgi:hypothetical protein